MSGHGTVDTAVEATRLGAFDFVEKPLSLAKLLRTVESALESAHKQAPPTRGLLPSILAPVGRSEAMRMLRERVQQYARIDEPVLLSGEPGTGRGAFARYLHALSDRADEPLISITAASLTEANAEAQLLGVESSGEIHAGAFERAGAGTLIIDGLGNLPDTAQKILLAALEDGMFSHVGRTAKIPQRARLVATVANDFESQIERGSLRRGLVSRFGVLHLSVPPLREYAEDVPELLSYYVDKLVDAEHLRFRRFSVAAQNRLAAQLPVAG